MLQLRMSTHKHPNNKEDSHEMKTVIASDSLKIHRNFRKLAVLSSRDFRIRLPFSVLLLTDLTQLCQATHLLMVLCLRGGGFSRLNSD